MNNKSIMDKHVAMNNDVLKHRTGSQIVLTILAQQFGINASWKGSVVLYRGKHCLLDNFGNLLDPSENWKITRFTKGETKIHHCTNKDLWLTLLCQIFLSAMLDGNLHNVHKAAYILTNLCEGDIHQMPFPLGS